MKLITKYLCPYCERVDLALKIRKISSETIHTEQIKNGEFPESLVSINCNKTFPTLQITSNLGFAESMIIVEYLDSIEATGPKLYGDSPENIAKIKFQVENIANKVTSFLQKCIYTFGSVVEERKSIARVTQAFDTLSSLLECRNSRFLGGDELNAEDIHLAPFVMRYLAARIFQKDLPLPEKSSRAEKYFNDISHHSIIRKCIPHLDEIAQNLANKNKSKGLNVDRIKASSRQLVANVGQSLNALNSSCTSIVWQQGKDDKGDFIYSKFIFKNSELALKAVHLLNELQEAADHHTAFTLENFTTLKVELCTHQPKYGVTEMDFAFAEILTNKISALA